MNLPHLLVVAIGLGASASFGCAPPTPARAPDGIRVEKEPPPAGARAVAELEAVDGKGCGLFGTRGSYEGALATLRLKAKAAGADYVRITAVKEPYADHQCTHKEYTISGTAYRLKPAPPPP